MLLRYFWYLLWISCPLATLGAQAQVTILADSTEMLIGDPLGLRIVVNVPRGAQPVFSSFSKTLEQEEVLELLEQGEQKFTSGEVNDTYELPFVITAWEPGQYSLAEFTVRYKERNRDSVYQLQAPPFNFVAAAPQVTGDSTYVADIKTIIAEPLNFWDYLYRVLTHPVVAILLFLMLSFTAFYSLIQYKNRLKERRERQTAEQWILEQLEQLEAQDYLSQHNFIAYHTRISLILRSYLRHRFKVEALEQPNSYFLPKVAVHPYLQGTTLFEEITTVLEQADLIKFAKASPLPIANEKAATLIRDLVKLVRARLAAAEAQKALAARAPKSVR